MNHTQDKDPLLAQLLRQLPMDEPSADFSQRIMAIIQQPEAVTAEPSSFLIRYRYWLIASAVVALVIVVTIFFPTFIENPQIQGIKNFFIPYVNAFKSIALLLKAQPILGIVITALAGLLLMDKLLSRMFHPGFQSSS